MMLLGFSCTNNRKADRNDSDSTLLNVEADAFQQSTTEPNIKSGRDSNSVEVLRDAETKKPITTEEMFTKNFHDIDGKVSVIAGTIKRSYNSRRVVLIIKNNTTKTVNAVRFEWLCSDAFGNLADLGDYYTEGFGTDYVENINLKPQGKTTVGFQINSTNASKITYAKATELAFADGSTWRRNDQ